MVRSLQYKLVVRVYQLWPQSVRDMHRLTHAAKRFDNIDIRLRIDVASQMFRTGENRFVFQHKRHRHERPELPIQNHPQKLSRCTPGASNSRHKHGGVQDRSHRSIISHAISKNAAAAGQFICPDLDCRYLSNGISKKKSSPPSALRSACRCSLAPRSGWLSSDTS